MPSPIKSNNNTSSSINRPTDLDRIINLTNNNNQQQQHQHQQQQSQHDEYYDSDSSNGTTNNYSSSTINQIHIEPASNGHNNDSQPPLSRLISDPTEFPLTEADLLTEETYLLQRDIFKANQRLQQQKAYNDKLKSATISAAATASKWYYNPGFLLGLYSLLLLLSSVGNSIFFKKMINHMENHVYFLTQLTSFIFVPISGILVLYELYYTKYITIDMQQFPKRKFFYMGVLDSLCGILTMFGAVHTAGSTQALLSNSVIPITMCLSYFILKQRFRNLQYIGATVIMAGIVTVLMPQILKSNGPINSDQQSELDNGTVEISADIPLFNILFIASVIPGALSSIYKELAFVNADIDANYLQYWVSVWQFIFGFVLAPLNTLSFLGNQSVEWNQLFSALTDGMYCLIGINTKLGDECAGSWIPLVIYLIFNFAFNWTSVLLIKYGSATLMFIIMTLRMPIVQWAFSIEWINSPPDKFGWWAGAGLLLILIGLVFYRWPTTVTSETDIESIDSSHSAVEQFLMPGVFDNRALYATIHHEQIVQRQLNRSAHQIRSALYSSLGVIDSPLTPNSPASRRFSPRNNKTPGAGAAVVGFNRSPNRKFNSKTTSSSYSNNNNIIPGPGPILNGNNSNSSHSSNSNNNSYNNAV